MQQHFIGELGDGFKTVLGPDRTRWCYPQRSYLDRGIPIPGRAIRMYTLHSAYASFEEHLKGSIEAGKLADLAILGADPTRINPTEIADIPVHGTIIGGKLLYGEDRF
jgi:predicted amidohydrolase YtcJ